MNCVGSLNSHHRQFCSIKPYSCECIHNNTCLHYVQYVGADELKILMAERVQIQATAVGIHSTLK